MAIFFSQPVLKGAVDRLAVCAAASSLSDYLIFKRAFKLSKGVARAKGEAEPDFVVTGTKSEPFVQAIEEFTLRVPRGGVDPRTLENPYYVPFGSKRDETLGYRTKKFPSNGSSDTVGRWQSRSAKPLALVPESSPKAYRFEKRTEKNLEEFFIIKNAAENFSSEKPRLIDTAVWWLRFSDLSERKYGDLTAKPISRLFIEDLELNETEISSLFCADDHAESIPLQTSEIMGNPEEYLLPAPQAHAMAKTGQEQTAAAGSSPQFDNALQKRVDEIIGAIGARGFVFEPWQIGAFITAVRTKPFVILAGISGTGKTKLPQIIAELSGAECHTIPVRPDWTDSSELLGYERLDGSFKPGELLRFAKKALGEPEKQFFFVLDEMNIARVEYYLAEVLSHIEELGMCREEFAVSAPLMPHITATEEGEKWSNVKIPSNLCIVGSVNMDETTFGFSKKVLDRAFVIEFSSIDLSAMGEIKEHTVSSAWGSEDWRVAAYNLASHPNREAAEVQQMIEVLTRVNDILKLGQLQFGYRVRDEIIMFCLAARQCAESFTTTMTGNVDPMDLAIAMKILPRIQGGGTTIERVLEALKSWASPDDKRAAEVPGTGENIGFPFCADRIAMMLRRLKESGFTTYWM